MSNELKVFENSEFGQLEIITIDGKEYFPAIRCAEILGYANPRDAIANHCRWVAKRDVPHPQNRELTIEKIFIQEGDLYRMIARSKLPAAEKFERWVFDEVLPSIRKHGMYAVDELADNPDLLIEIAQKLKIEREEKKRLAADKIGYLRFYARKGSYASSAATNTTCRRNTRWKKVCSESRRPL
jgi:prophage antirepressor-like protein